MDKLDLIKETITCSTCHCIFSKPVFLPCSNTICERHVLENTRSNNKYDCSFCKQQHSIPMNGFAVNQMAKKLIESEVYLSDSEKKLRDEVEKNKSELNSIINLIEKKMPDFERIKFESLTELKCQLDLKREEMKLKIDNYVDSIIEKYVTDEKELVKQIEGLNLGDSSLKSMTSDFRSKFETAFKSKTIKMNDLKALQDELKEQKINLKQKLEKLKNINYETSKMFNQYKYKFDLEQCFGIKIKGDDDDDDDDECALNDPVDNVCDHFLSHLYDLALANDLNESASSTESDELDDLFAENQLVTLTKDKVISTWDLRDEECTGVFNDYKSQIRDIYPLSDGKLLTLSFCSIMKLWDLDRRKFLKVLNKGKGPIDYVLEMPNDIIVVASESRIQILNMKESKTKALQAHAGKINVLRKFTDEIFISGSNDCLVKMWDVKGNLIKAINEDAPVTDVGIRKIDNDYY